MDQLDTMRAFVAVASQGSFVGAARRLRLSPSAVTRGIALLEARLGLTLVHRTTRAVSLTEPGTAYLESCRRILDDIEAAERDLRGEDAALRSHLHVTAPVMFGRLHLVPVIAGLLGTYPGLSIRLTLTDRLVHLAEDGIDVAVRIGHLADSTLIAARVGWVERVLIASPDYLARRGVPEAPADLARHDVIAFENADKTDEWQFGTGAGVRLEPRLTLNNADAAIEAARIGIGITRALSYQVQAAAAAGELTIVLRAHQPPPLPISALFPARRANAPAVRAFITTTREHVGRIDRVGQERQT